MTLIQRRHAAIRGVSCGHGGCDHCLSLKIIKPEFGK
jgi:hypothetical protein